MKTSITLLLALFLCFFSNAQPCNVGGDSSRYVCVNEPCGLIGVLSGTPDTGGQWYDSTNNEHDGFIDAGEQPDGGTYIYYYVLSGSDCDTDTSYATLYVEDDPGCYLGIEEKNSVALNPFPNPTQNILYFENIQQSELHFQLFDLNGQLLIETGLGPSNTSVNIEHLKEGVYILNLTENSGISYSYRIIKE